MPLAAIDPERYARFLAPAGTAAAVAAALLGNIPLAGLALFLFALACWSRPDGLLLLGPFARLELTRQSRKHRVHLWRTVVFVFFGIVPFLPLYYFAHAADDDLRIPTESLRMVGEGVFLATAFYLFLITTSITATFLSTAVTEDREANRLDFLLVTDLRNREIVFGKAAARAFGAVGYMFPVVPVIVLFPAFFSIDPYVVAYIAGYAAVSTFSIGGVALLGSVMAKTKKLSGQYQAKYIFPYFFFGWALEQLRHLPEVWLFPGTPAASAAFSVGDAVELFNIGNPFLIVPVIGPAIVTGLNLAPVAAAFPAYAAFHIGAGLVAFLLAAKRLRLRAAELAGEGPPPAAVEAAAKRPPVYAWPIVWKEMYAIPQQFLTRGGQRQAKVIGFLFVVVPATAFLAAAVSDLGGYADGVREAARFVPAMIAWIGIAVSMGASAVCVAKERERDTLTSLLLTDLSVEDILRQKFVGVLAQTRGVYYWQLWVGIPAVLCGAYEWWALLVLIVTQAVYSVCAAALGMVVTATAATTEKASRAIAFIIAGSITGLAVGSGLMTALLATPGGGGPQVELFALAGLFPPAVLLGAGQTHALPPGALPYALLGVVAGWVLYLMLGWLFWRWARRRFLRACDGDNPPVAAGGVVK